MQMRDDSFKSHARNVQKHSRKSLRTIVAVHAKEKEILKIPENKKTHIGVRVLVQICTPEYPIYLCSCCREEEKPPQQSSRPAELRDDVHGGGGEGDSESHGPPPVLHNLRAARQHQRGVPHEPGNESACA